MTRRSVVIAAVALTCAGRSIPAQVTQAPSTQADSEARAFNARALAGIEQYHDRRAAIAAGFHRVGAELPSMGEHWLNTRLALEGRFDVGRPAMLTYAMIDGRPVLTGAVYLVPLAPGESPPALPASLHATLHEHNGTLDDEARTPEHGVQALMHHDEAHATSPGAANTTPRVRLALLHAWVVVPNPDGLFKADNWALPFVRLGLAIPGRIPVSSARALSLLTGGDVFFAGLVNTDDGATTAEREAIRTLLSDSRARTEKLLAHVGADRHLSGDDLAALDASWRQLIDGVAAATSKGVAERFRAVAAPPM